MLVETQAGPDQLVEMARQIIGEEEGGHVLVLLRLESFVPGKEGIAMGAGNSLDPLFLQQPVELAAGAAIAIKDEDRPVFALGFADLVADGRHDELRRVVPFGRKAGDVEGNPAVGLDKVDDLARQSSAGDQQHMALAVEEFEFLGRFDIDEGHAPILVSAPRYHADAASRLCLRFMKSFAVSTATAASRQ